MLAQDRFDGVRRFLQAVVWDGWEDVVDDVQITDIMRQPVEWAIIAID